jgi:hypothetical protein
LEEWLECSEAERLLLLAPEHGMAPVSKESYRCSTISIGIATMSKPAQQVDAAVISSPQIHLKIAAEADEKKESAADEKKAENPTSNGAAKPEEPKPAPVTRAIGSLNPFLASVPVTATVTRKQPFILQDTEGNEKSFGSALGLLTRKFVNIIHVRILLSSIHSSSLTAFNRKRKRIHNKSLTLCYHCFIVLGLAKWNGGYERNCDSVAGPQAPHLRHYQRP